MVTPPSDHARAPLDGDHAASPPGPVGPASPPPILVGVDWLAGMIVDLDDAGVSDRRRRVVVCDVRWYLDGRDAATAYRHGHLPGARFVDLDTVCSAPHPSEVGHPTDGRHPLPSPERFAATVGALGIGDGDIVVAYDDSGGGTAGRFVWMLRALEAPAMLLDGGLAAWLAAHPGRLDTGDAEPCEPATFTARPWPADRLAGWDDAERAGGTDAGPPADRPLLLDARAPDRYRGDTEPVDRRAGHIPGAVNLPWATLVDPDTRRFLPTPELARVLRAAGITADTDVVASCGSGVSACALLVALEHVGHARARLFVPSWSGWSSDPDRPVAVGATP